MAITESKKQYPLPECFRNILLVSRQGSQAYRRLKSAPMI
jgi:hypothetical protein